MIEIWLSEKVKSKISHSQKSKTKYFISKPMTLDCRLIFVSDNCTVTFLLHLPHPCIYTKHRHTSFRQISAFLFWHEPHTNQQNIHTGSLSDKNDQVGCTINLQVVLSSKPPINQRIHKIKILQDLTIQFTKSLFLCIKTTYCPTCWKVHVHFEHFQLQFYSLSLSRTCKPSRRLLSFYCMLSKCFVILLFVVKLFHIVKGWKLLWQSSTS